MSLNEDCPVQQHEEMIIKTEAVEDDKVDNSLLASSKLKCEDEENYSRSAESNNFENISSSCSLIKIEPEDSSPGPDDLRRMQGAENLRLKEEDIDIEEHKPGWELIKGSSSHVGMLKDGLDRCESVQQSESRSSEMTREEQAKYNCAHCSFKTKYRSHFTWHYNCKHSKYAEVFKCQECSYETKNRSTFTQHYKRQHPNNSEVYKCQECSFETKWKSYLTLHYKHKHSNKSEVYKCQECSFETKWKNHLTRHYKHTHSNNSEVYKCQECPHKTSFKHNLTRHYKYKHSNSNNNPEVYKCQECSFETKWKSYMTRHYKYKHSNKSEVYKCQECSFETKWKRYMTRHYKIKHSKDSV